MNDTLATVLGVAGACFTVVNLIFMLLNFGASKKKDFKQDTISSEARLNDINQSLIKVNMKLDQVCATTTNIQADIRTMQSKQIEHTEQLVKLEGRVDRAFERIDELRNMMNS